MLGPRSTSPVRCLAVWLGLSAAAGATACWLVGVLEAQPAAALPAGRGFDELLVSGCAGLALLSVAWLWVLATAVVLEAFSGVRAPGVPAAVRRLVLGACGAAVLAGTCLPAQATPGELHQDRGPRRPAAIAGLPYPDRSTGSSHPEGRVVAVRPGDTLWGLARRDLGPAATDAEVADRWHAIYQLNRAVIGADPDVLRPEQRLRLPSR